MFTTKYNNTLIHYSWEPQPLLKHAFTFKRTYWPTLEQSIQICYCKSPEHAAMLIKGWNEVDKKDYKYILVL